MSGGNAFWREALAAYERPHLGRSLLDLFTSVVPYLALSVLMYRALDVSYLLVLAMAIPAAGFLVRSFIVFHDCAHGSFLGSKRANAWLGVGVGLLVFESFANWRHKHAVHHGTAGDLDRRGVGDVLTLTVAEYQSSSWRQRLGYRLFRNPLVMFGLGPIYGMIVHPRLVPRSARPRIRRSVIATNVALAVLVGALCWLVGWREFLLVQKADVAGQFLQRRLAVLGKPNERGPPREAVEVAAVRLHRVVRQPALGAQVVAEGGDVGLQFTQAHGPFRLWSLVIGHWSLVIGHSSFVKTPAEVASRAND